ncbi:MAG: hypothetical protein ACPIOQ_32040, partial [Promethearchaeia archaeon]
HQRKGFGRMAGRAGGLSSDYKARRLLMEGGALSQLGVKALEKGVKRLRDLDSVPGLDRNVRKKIEEARQALTAGLFGVNKGTSDLLRGSGMEYAANKKMREVLDSYGSASGPCNLIDAINACGVSSASGGAVCSITSGSTVPPSDLVTSHRLRPIDVNGIKIDQPANGGRAETYLSRVEKADMDLGVLHMLARKGQKSTGRRGRLARKCGSRSNHQRHVP